MEQSLRPNPDELLAALKQESDAHGQLHLFLGMSAGVGKTYAMLEAAHARFKEGLDVVIGVVETHGRKETMALLAGLPLLPRKEIEYRGTTLTEMDLDAILERQPQLVLVDELAHSNVATSRHPKRWQDVFEILEAGIDVYTTLNVQHIESRKEMVEGISGIRIGETVPDSILERANQIELVDITPNDLLKRLKEGKVYLGDKAERAALNFFKEDRLAALREIALRVTAEKVDNALRRSGSWKTSQKLMVALSYSPHSKRLIRSTRALAFAMEAPWFAVNVDTGAKLNPKEIESLNQNLDLSRELGAEVLTVSDPDWVSALKRVAQEKRVTQIIMGRPRRLWLRDIFQGGNLLDRLLAELRDVDIHVLHQDKLLGGKARRISRIRLGSNPLDYWNALWLIAATAVLGALLVPFVGYRSVGFVFLLAVSSISLFFSLGPIMFSAILSALIWDFLFIPPAFTLVIHQPDDAMMCLAYVLVAFITGTLTHRTREREKLLVLREKRTETIYEIMRRIVEAQDRQGCIDSVSNRLGDILNGKCHVALKSSDGNLENFPMPHGWRLNENKERAVADWVFQNAKPAGLGTSTLPKAAAKYLPLKGPSEVVGVLAFQSEKNVELLPDEENLLSTVVAQLGVYLERELFKERSLLTQKLEQSERLHEAILNSVSHELRTPITTIMGSATALENAQVLNDPVARTQMTRELIESAERLNQVVGNLLDMSRISAGSIALKKDWHDMADLVQICLGRLKKSLALYPVTLDIQENLPLLKMDAQLFEQVLMNLLGNVANHTPAGTPIEIKIFSHSKNLTLEISDQGPGISEPALARIFDKFYRAPGSTPGGTGLGLAIVKSIVSLHDGKISAHNITPHGCQFVIQMPVEKQPELPVEIKI